MTSRLKDHATLVDTNGILGWVNAYLQTQQDRLIFKCHQCVAFPGWKKKDDLMCMGELTMYAVMARS